MHNSVSFWQKMSLFAKTEGHVLVPFRNLLLSVEWSQGSLKCELSFMILLQDMRIYQLCKTLLFAYNAAGLNGGQHVENFIGSDWLSLSAAYTSDPKFSFVCSNVILAKYNSSFIRVALWQAPLVMLRRGFQLFCWAAIVWTLLPR